jgi:hypothetical protein
LTWFISITVIVRLIIRFKTIIVYSLLILFLGYYGSITLFYHSHLVLGDTIVHSHPYWSDNQGMPSHTHSEKGYVTIQLLSFFAVSFLFIYFSFKTIAPLVFKILLKIIEGHTDQIFNYFYLLRAPPCGMLK